MYFPPPEEEDEPDHTVELEALPGGAEAQPAHEEHEDRPDRFS